MQPEPSLGEPRDTDLLAASSDAVGGRRVVGGRKASGNGPEEIRAATQRRLLGAFRFSGLAASASARSPFRVVPRQYRAPGGRRPAARSRRDATRRGHQPRRAARDPRGRRFGQDARAHPPHRVAVARGPRRSAPRPRAHVHAQGRRRAPHPARRGSGSTMRSPPARSTPSRSRSCAAAPKTSSARCPRCSSARCACSCRSSTSAGAKPGCAPPSSRPRSNGRRRGSCAPTATSKAVTLAARTPPRPAAEVADVFREYERLKRRRGLVDFDDLISGCADVLERDADFAAAQRWRFRHLFVDEFQDASPAQFRLLRSWLGDRSDLCVVGDGDQAIYGFAGADPTFLVRFTAQFPPERFPDVGVVRLGSNYRSTPQVVAAAGAVLGISRRAPRCTPLGPTAPLPSSPRTTPTTTKRAASPARSAPLTHRTCPGRASPSSTG